MSVLDPISTDSKIHRRAWRTFSCFPALLTELQKRGYSESDLKKVAGQNLLRVLRAVESKPR